jgi:serine/threonine protein kinase
MNDELIGQKIGGYEIASVIGRGGMATVYKAHQVSMNRTVALKVLPRHFATDESYLQRFHQEVKIVSQLEHRSIVPVYDHGEHEGQPYLTMRFMSGGSVDDLLTNGPMPLDRILSILEQIAPALDYAHSKGVLHRDMKPSNVLMDDDHGAYLTDFGIARVLGETGGQITTQGIVGTPSYMSPEQAQGQPLDARSDLYGLGVMLFEMATGRRPFESETPYSIAVMQVTTPPPMPRAVNPALPQVVESVILKALKKRKEDRFNTAAELVAALKQAINEPAVDLSDTQPGFPADMPTAPNPAPVQAPAPSQQYPLPQPVPVMTPPPPQTPLPSSASLVAVPRVPKRKKRPNNMLFGTLFGGLIGCGLLTLMVVGAALFLQETSRRANVQATATARANPAESDSNSETPVIGAPAPLGGATSPALDAAVDPGDGLLYFVERSGRDDIYLMPLTSRTPQRLTENAGNNQFPIISPDGSRIAFQSDRDGSFDIYVMNLDGSNVQRLTDNAVNDRLPSWSADGEWLVFATDTRGDGSDDLAMMRADGSDFQILFSNGQRNSHPRWSADSRYVVFTTGAVNDARTWEIARYDVLSGELVLLTENDLKDWSPSFGEDSASILYLTEGEGYAAIATMGLNGEDSQILYDGTGYESAVSLSPDGARIAFSSDATGRDELYIMTAEGADVQQVSSTGGHAPSWLVAP